MSLYVYALVDEPRALPAGLEAVALDGVSAIVREVAAAPELATRALQAHDATMRAIGAPALLPMRFGMVAAGAAELRAQLEPMLRSLRESLALVRGREQMTLRLFGERPSAQTGGGPGTRYLAARRGALPDLAPLRRALGELPRAERIELHSAGALLASVYHLVDRGASREYAHAVEECGLPLALSGPWPAYAFAPEAAS
jgi:hypothetical protein